MKLPSYKPKYITNPSWYLEPVMADGPAGELVAVAQQVEYLGENFRGQEADK